MNSKLAKSNMLNNNKSNSKENASDEFSSAEKSNWTWERNKKFEVALAKYDEDVPDRWAKIAEEVGGTDEEEVKRMYDLLVRDIDLILSGQVPLPDYQDDYAEGSDNDIYTDKKDISSNPRDLRGGNIKEKNLHSTMQGRINKEKKLSSAMQLKRKANEKQFMKPLEFP